MEGFSHHAKVGVTRQGIRLVFHSSLRNGGTRRKIQVFPDQVFKLNHQGIMVICTYDGAGSDIVV